MKINLTDMTDDELRQLSMKIAEEELRRRTIYEAEARVNEVKQRMEREISAISSSYLAARDGGDDTEWIAPSGAHDAYPKDWTVQHNGKKWVSVAPANVHEPGGPGWRQVTEDGSPAPWVQPIGGHDVYEQDDLVTHDGKTWRSTIEDNVWEPPLYWTDVTPVEEPDEEAPGIPEWSPTARYEYGDRVWCAGRLYECLVGHGAEYQGTWKPGVAHSVWKDLGPVA